MSTLTIGAVRSRGQQYASRVSKSAFTMLSEATRAQSTVKTYDIFLSHCSLDSEAMLGLKVILEQDYGHSVYIDWLEDPQLDRSSVTRATAEVLRTRMNNCKSLFFAATTNSTDSKWMPWECGYFDGKKNRAAILPLTVSPASDYKGQEYLGVYPYVMEATPQGGTKKTLWVHKTPSLYVAYTSWLAGVEPSQH